MKILCLCSTLDLSYRYGCTPAWWQLFKGLYELGHDVIAVPYQGKAIESPWWRVYSNPCELEGNTFSKVKGFFSGRATSTAEGIGGTITKTAIDSWVRPRWESHIAAILEKERNVDAVIVFTIPLNHFTGIPARLRARFRTPFYYYDGDVPASLPRFGGYASGFKIYEGGDLTEYDGVLCNSEGGAQDLTALGAKKVETVFWGVDPDLYMPTEIVPDRDVFFYGLGKEYRKGWIESMLVAPSRALPEVSFAVGGKGLDDGMGRIKLIGEIPSNRLRVECGRSKINLNIARDAHASVYASSSTRLFELASLGCCIVSNPCAGMDRWFEAGKEVIVVNSAEEASAEYTRLLADDAARRSLGEAARRRVLAHHTHKHRAAQIVEFIRPNEGETSSH
jgi:glycosyltransferase involved in cell wall biosynthesis